MFIDVLITVLKGTGNGLEDSNIKVIYDYSTKKQIGSEYNETDLQFALDNENKILGDDEEVLFRKVKAVFISGKYFITTDF